MKGCDCILHAGDVTKESLLDQIRFLGNLYVVRGNNDGDWAKGIAKSFDISDRGRFFCNGA
ncbi:MAG: metallophosphoesterase family protein [Eubacterium ramulus]